MNATTNTSRISAYLASADETGEMIYRVALMAAGLDAPLFFDLVLFNGRVECLDYVESSLETFLDAPCADLKLQAIDEAQAHSYTAQFPGMDTPILCILHRGRIEHICAYTSDLAAILAA